MFTKIRLVRLGGEPVTPKDIEVYQKHFGKDCLLVNALASTETETICQYFMDHNTQFPGTTIPVGYPVRDKRILLLDEDGQSVQDGKIGEIVVESGYLGPGYWLENRARHPHALQGPGPVIRTCHTGDLGIRLPDGCILLVGRSDWTTKIHGQRVNLVEIEHALLRLKDIEQAAVVTHPGMDGNPFLTAYIQSGTRSAPSKESIRRALGAFLPDFMIPSTILFLDSMPLTPGGKIDRLSLPYPDPGQERAEVDHALAGSSIENILADIWRTVLKVDQVGVDDTFHELGGDSFMVALLVEEIEEKFQRDISINDLIHHDTIRKLAELLSRAKEARSPDALVTLQPLGDKPPLFLAPGLGSGLLYLHDLVVEMGVDRPIIGLQDVGLEDESITSARLDVKAAAYVKEISAAYPHGPFFLAGHSFGGIIALEIARQLLALGEQVPALVLLDTLPPGGKRGAPLLKRLGLHWENIRLMETPKNFLAYASDRLSRLAFRLIRFRLIRWLVEHSKISVKDQIAAARVGLAWYNPLPYPGNAALFKVSQRPDYVTWDPMTAWQDFIAGDLVVREVPGNHTNLLKVPHVGEVARLLKSYLDGL